MLICEVVGHVWATKKEDNLNGLKLMVVRQIESRQEQGMTVTQPVTDDTKDDFVAVDVVGAGIGERVLVISGSSARRALKNDEVSADAAIVAIIDSIETVK